MKHQILIFTTSVSKKKQIKHIRTLLKNSFKIFNISLDFEDWEKVLKVECCDVSELEIISKLRTININAAVLNH
ncbi:hypothetical protein [Prevotella herbatica]|uniref:hypothetical protein n=1 Tax=Prevotella herbatica TaxID=2801997 RepID=UPI001A9264FC|nr:hypothetical protein [Prevotella herbatica]